MVFFFKQKTAYEWRISDWSSDVCSSDLRREDERFDRLAAEQRHRDMKIGQRPCRVHGGKSPVQHPRRTLPTLGGRDPCPHRPEQETPTVAEAFHWPVDEGVHRFPFERA